MSISNVSNLMSPNTFDALMQAAQTPSLNDSAIPGSPPAWDSSSSGCVTFGEVTPTPVETTDDVIMGCRLDISIDGLPTPEQTPIKKDDDSHLREELYFIFDKLEKFMKKDDQAVLEYEQGKRTVLKHRIDLLSSNMTCLKTGYTKYEELYKRILQRLGQEVFAEFFNN